MLMTRGTEADPRWPRILVRDASADGAFWYSVATTGVYCRPSCPSRAARPENVAIHDTLEDARRTGFRPCRRCRPEEALAPAAALAERVCRRIEAAEVAPGLAVLAAAEGLSPARLAKAFRAATGITPARYAAALRAGRLREALAGAPSVTEALHQAGYGSSGRFYEDTDRALGMTPTAARAGGAGERLRVAVGQGSLGHVLVAASDRGIAAILIGDEPDVLARDLRRRFPHAELVPGDEGFADTVARVVALVEQPAAGLALPLDMRGTAFQARVWAALARVKPGETVSYAELARAAGVPGAVRAVAGACAANPLAVAIPCHRVVRSDGGLSGYRWGIERKRALLRREAPDCEDAPPRA